MSRELTIKDFLDEMNLKTNVSENDLKCILDIALIYDYKLLDFQAFYSLINFFNVFEEELNELKDLYNNEFKNSLFEDKNIFLISHLLFQNANSNFYKNLDPYENRFTIINKNDIPYRLSIKLGLIGDIGSKYHIINNSEAYSLSILNEKIYNLLIDEKDEEKQKYLFELYNYIYFSCLDKDAEPINYSTTIWINNIPEVTEIEYENVKKLDELHNNSLLKIMNFNKDDINTLITQLKNKKIFYFNDKTLNKAILYKGNFNTINLFDIILHEEYYNEALNNRLYGEMLKFKSDYISPTKKGEYISSCSLDGLLKTRQIALEISSKDEMEVYKSKLNDYLDRKYELNIEKENYDRVTINYGYNLGNDGEREISKRLHEKYQNYFLNKENFDQDIERYKNLYVLPKDLKETLENIYETEFELLDIFYLLDILEENQIDVINVNFLTELYDKEYKNNDNDMNIKNKNISNIYYALRDIFKITNENDRKYNEYKKMTNYHDSDIYQKEKEFENYKGDKAKSENFIGHSFSDLGYENIKTLTEKDLRFIVNILNQSRKDIILNKKNKLDIFMDNEDNDDYIVNTQIRI